MRIRKTLLCVLDLVDFPFFFPSKPDAAIANGEDTTSSEEEKEDQNIHGNVGNGGADSGAPSSRSRDATEPELLRAPVTSQHKCSVNGSDACHSDDDDAGGGDENENVRDALGVGDPSVPTIYFSHTVEPKRVCILLTFLILHIT